MKSLKSLFVVLVSAFVLAGCGGSSSSTSVSTDGVTGLSVPGSVSTVPAN